jgi:peptide/nickel transport system substrate-binding protein
MKQGRCLTIMGLVAVLVASACSSSKSSQPPPSATGTGPGTVATAQPQTGGILTMATYIEPPGLDPLVASGSGDLGGTEMMAIYDSVMRYNPATGKYEPKTAESLTPNADDTV